MKIPLNIIYAGAEWKAIEICDVECALCGDYAQSPEFFYENQAAKVKSSGVHEQFICSTCMIEKLRQTSAKIAPILILIAMLLVLTSSASAAIPNHVQTQTAKLRLWEQQLKARERAVKIREHKITELERAADISVQEIRAVRKEQRKRTPEEQAQIEAVQERFKK